MVNRKSSRALWQKTRNKIRAKKIVTNEETLTEEQINLLSEKYFKKTKEVLTGLSSKLDEYYALRHTNKSYDDYYDMKDKYKVLSDICDQIDHAINNIKMQQKATQAISKNSLQNPNYVREDYQHLLLTVKKIRKSD